jgi:serine/threonine protein kinase
VMAFDADVAKGLHFLVMEYVEGINLSALIKEHGPLSFDRAIQCTLQAARGLAYAHEQNVIHRDIKPGNLILDQFDAVRILDMGLARLNDSIRSASHISLTKTNVVMGTIDFMSPEQAMNSKYVDHRGDIYSLGMTLYYLLTGQPAYGGDTAVERLIAHRESPLASLKNARQDVDSRLDAIFQKMIAKQPQDRYQSMEEVIAALQAFAEGGTGDAQSSASPSEESTMNAFLLSLETVPAFVPQIPSDGESFDAKDPSSISELNGLPGPDSDFDWSADRKSVIGGSPAAKSDPPSRSQVQRQSHRRLAIMSTALAMISTMLLLNSGARGQLASGNSNAPSTWADPASEAAPREEPVGTAEEIEPVEGQTSLYSEIDLRPSFGEATEQSEPWVWSE